jgi:hypothetical protein
MAVIANAVWLYLFIDSISLSSLFSSHLCISVIHLFPNYILVVLLPIVSSVALLRKDPVRSMTRLTRCVSAKSKKLSMQFKVPTLPLLSLEKAELR